MLLAVLLQLVAAGLLVVLLMVVVVQLLQIFVTRATFRLFFVSILARRNARSTAATITTT